MTGFIGGGIMMCGSITALAVVDAPMAVATAAMFGATGVAGAWVRLRRHRRSRGQGMRLPPPTQWKARAVELQKERIAARPLWTDGDREWLEGHGAALPEARGRWL